MIKIKKLIISTLILFLLVTAAISVSAQEEEARYGGTLNAAIKMSVAHLDTDNSTDSLISAMMNHVYEGLFEFDENLKVQPHLA